MFNIISFFLILLLLLLLWLPHCRVLRKLSFHKVRLSAQNPIPKPQSLFVWHLP